MIPIATIYSLEMSANGSPWCRTAPNATQSTDVDALLYSADGSPWWGHYPTGLVWTTKTLKAYIGGVWVAKPLKQYITGAWTEKPLKKYG